MTNWEKLTASGSVGIDLRTATEEQKDNLVRAINTAHPKGERIRKMHGAACLILWSNGAFGQYTAALEFYAHRVVVPIDEAISALAPEPEFETEKPWHHDVHVMD